MNNIARRHSPILFLSLLAGINYGAYASWVALLNNFAKDAVEFTGRDMGLLQSIREIPGLFAVSALIFLLFMREQTLAYISLAVLGTGIAVTGYYPSITGLWITTFIMSVGFHYYETMSQSLSLQLVAKAEAPRILGAIASAQAIAQLGAFALIMSVWWLDLVSYRTLFAASGGLAIFVTVCAALYFPKFDGPVAQRKSIVLRKKYWLYYALTMMSGARRQIFTAFGGFLLVEKFQFDVTHMAFLFLLTYGANTIIAPRLGSAIQKFGERRTIMFENIILIMVFLGYALVNNASIAAMLFVLDGICFTLVIAQRTYFQKIADPQDIAPTAGVAFTINHLAAVFIPAIFGLVWLWNPSAVFLTGAGIASISLTLAFLVPFTPHRGNETIWSI